VEAACGGLRRRGRPLMTKQALYCIFEHCPGSDDNGTHKLFDAWSGREGGGDTSDVVGQFLFSTVVINPAPFLGPFTPSTLYWYP
jgi:hypothetical protein